MWSKGFVFGKFYPFHKGHVALIDFAATHCHDLTILVCASNCETIPLETRCAWIKQHYTQQTGISVLGYAYDEATLPNTSVASRAVSAVWAKAFSAILPDRQVLFTAESYGDWVAEAMHIQHILFDQARLTSASQIRVNPLQYWHYLPLSVRAHYVKKVVLLGTESTGKTTLTQQLATYFDTNFVSEAGRDIVDNSYECSPNHLLLIAQTHARAIKQALPLANKILFIDTDIHITNSYSQFLFGKPLDVSPDIYDINCADLYLFLDNDAPFVQDGTRLDEPERNRLHDSHLAVLQACDIPLVWISGDWDERFAASVKAVLSMGI